MRRMYILPSLAALGVLLAIAAIFYGDRPAGDTTQEIPDFQPPFDTFVFGVGIAEAPSGNISVGALVSGVVKEISVKVGDHVQSGDPLFKIDDSDLQAQLVSIRAEVQAAEAALQKPRHSLEYAENARKLDREAISQKDLSDARDELAKAEAEFALARARHEQLQMEIERRTVHAPVSGEVLQLKMRLGEYVEASQSLATPLLLLGSDDRMNLRIDIDQNDAWRFEAGAEAVAYVRGNPSTGIPLLYEYTEPYVVPKKTLTGQSTERTDTRVLQVLYSFEVAGLPVYAGELFDVYIQSDSTGKDTSHR